MDLGTLCRITRRWHLVFLKDDLGVPEEKPFQFWMLFPGEHGFRKGGKGRNPKEAFDAAMAVAARVLADKASTFGTRANPA